MEKYEILQNGDNEMTISFYFNKKALIVPLIIFFSILLLIFSQLKPELLVETSISIIIATSALAYMLFNDYFE